MKSILIVALAIVAKCCLLLEVAAAQEALLGKMPPSLAGVAWAGGAPSKAALAGKTVVVITYVTWCPKCNAWSGDMLSEIKQATADKPVVLMAISTDTPPAEAVQYMQTRNFVGPNVFLGHDPTIAKRFGFTGEFFNYAVVGPEGKIIAGGNAGSRYADGKSPSFECARELTNIKDYGSFRFVKTEMSPALKERLWLVELGASKALGRDFKKMEKGLSAEDTELLRKTIADFVESEATAVEELSKSEEVPDKLTAIDRATFLNSQFANTPAGKRGKAVLTELQKDASLKQEAAAKKQYELAMKIVDQDRRAKTLDLLAEKYTGTYFGKQASEAAKATE